MNYFDCELLCSQLTHVPYKKLEGDELFLIYVTVGVTFDLCYIGLVDAVLEEFCARVTVRIKGSSVHLPLEESSSWHVFLICFEVIGYIRRAVIMPASGYREDSVNECFKARGNCWQKVRIV